MKQVLCIVISCLLLAGCIPDQAVPVGSSEIAITVTDQGFLPRTVIVPAGETITLTVDNQSARTVTLSLLGRVLTPPVDAADDILWQADAPGAASTTLTLTSPQAAAEYDLVISGLAQPGTPEWSVAFVATRP